jgi:hypothetical protein
VAQEREGTLSFVTVGILSSITTLEKINDKPAAELWKGVDARQKKRKP